LCHSRSEVKPKVVIHCAAERRTDVVAKDLSSAANLNVQATQTIAQLSHEVCSASVLSVCGSTGKKTMFMMG
jgi:dTDP-4-dehydrorhamnose reductase